MPTGQPESASTRTNPKDTNVINVNPYTAAKLDDMHAGLAKLTAEARAIENRYTGERREPTHAENSEIAQISARFELLHAEMKREEAMSVPNRRLTQPADIGDEMRPAMSITGGLPVGVSRGSSGFRTVGDWAVAARKTSRGNPDPRILHAPTSYGSEGANADGGFAVPPDFRENIMKQVLGEDSLLALCDQQVTSSNALTLPLDTTTPWQSSGGVTAAWTGEGAAITQTKPSLGMVEVKLNKLAALVPVSDELMEDAPALTTWLSTKVPDKFTSAINDAFINGNGNGKPQGMLNAPCKVTQAAESGQGAGTITSTNVMKMWSRLYGKLRRNAVWLANQDAEQQLQQLVLPGTSPAFPAYLPPGGFSQSPYSTLFGRPVIVLEGCQAVGTEGDLILCDPTQYLAVLKTGGMRTDVSLHLYFDTDTAAFRFVMRVGGQSYWPAAVARSHGNNTLSPIVTLNSSRT